MDYDRSDYTFRERYILTTLDQLQHEYDALLKIEGIAGNNYTTELNQFGGALERCRNCIVNRHLTRVLEGRNTPEPDVTIYVNPAIAKELVDND